MIKNLILFILATAIFFNFKIFAQDLGQFQLQPGFNIEIFASDLDSPRQMAEGKNGTIFVGERGGQIIALSDSDRNGQADSKRVIAESLTYSTGVSIFEGDLYFSEISKIWKIKDIESWLQKNNSGLPEKILVTDDLIGLNPTNVRFVKKFANITKQINTAIIKFKDEVKNKKFPKKVNSY